VLLMVLMFGAEGGATAARSNHRFNGPMVPVQNGYYVGWIRANVAPSQIRPAPTSPRLPTPRFHQGSTRASRRKRIWRAPSRVIIPIKAGQPGRHRAHVLAL